MGTLLAALLKLSELVVNGKFCVVLISAIAWEQFKQNESISTDPLRVHFPVYTKGKRFAIRICNGKEEVFEILCREHGNSNLEEFQSLLNIVWSSFYNICRDLSELRFIVKSLFPKYIEPITKGEGLYK